MGVYKLSAAGGVGTARTNYNTFLAGNPRFIPSSYESIATVNVGSGGAANVQFTSIPSTYKHLQVRAIAYASSGGNIQGQFNSDTGTNYVRHYMYGDGASAVGGADTSINYVNFGYVPSSSNYFSAAVTDILDYTSTSKNKTIRTFTGYDANGSGLVVVYSGLWFATPTAITSINLTPQSGTFSQYSSFALYGIKGA
jgi:hypothetical protein